MEAVTSLISSSPPLPPSRTLSRTPPHSSPSIVPMMHEQVAHAVDCVQTTSMSRHFPLVYQEHHDDLNPLLHVTQDDKFQAVLDPRSMKNTLSSSEEERSSQYYQNLKDLECQLLYWPGFWYLFSSSFSDGKPSVALCAESAATEAAKIVGIETSMGMRSISSSMRPWDVLALAKKALVASKEAASLAESCLPSSAIDSSGPADLGILASNVEASVRSVRHLARRSVNRRVPKCPKDASLKVSRFGMTDADKKVTYKDFDPNDPLRLFLLDPQTKQLLSVKEEWDLSIQIQELMRLEEVKQKLQLQFGREPTMVEWAEAVEMNCKDLRLCLHSGNKSRQKMIIANFRLVVHVAKQYQNRGLSFQDLLQEGSMGLMRSLKKFKPEVGCRFSTYAYWWIRQSIRRALVQNSRTIRLPESVYALLTQVRNARRSCMQEGHNPTIMELAKRVGISVDKLEMLLISAQNPVSIQQTAWKDQDVTIQEITADPEIETPEIGARKQLMRRHVRNLLSVLKPRERQIIRLRYGIHDGEEKTLSEIGAVFGLCKERVRQVENRAMQKLKHHLSSEGLDAYVDMLI